MGAVAPAAKAAAAAGTDPEASHSLAEVTTPTRRWKKWHLYAVNGIGLAACIAVGLYFAIGDKATSSNSLTGPRVEFNHTTYVGTTRESGINVFLGMRYAEAPLDDLRWRAPVEPTGRDEGSITTAKVFGPICLATDAPFPNGQQSEDCLFANVWAPADATASSKLPVWLFIQGGGYTANANANWDGEEVVKRSNKSIVFVNFNYRVGVYGFLASEQVKEDGDLNVGLLDQRFMMQWIQKYISKFGGDPNHVVISGLSAGAGSVALQLAAYGGQTDNKLFAGAIVQSMFFPAQPYLSELEWQFDRLAASLGCDGDPDKSMTCLRSKSTKDLQAGNKASPFPGRSQPPLPLFYWTPCIDGDLIRKLPYDMFDEGENINIPLMIGTSSDEGTYFAANAKDKDGMLEFLHNNYPGLRERDLDDIGDRYPLMDPLPMHESWFPSTSMAYGEATFICPTLNVLDDLAANFPGGRNKTWAYRFNVLDKDLISRGLGVPHTSEVGAVFGPTSVGDQASASYYTYNSPIVPIVMDYWISFVKALSPNALKNVEAPNWGSYAGVASTNSSARVNSTAEVGSRARLVLETGSTHMEQVPSEQVSRCGFWKSLKDQTQQKS